MPRRLIRRTSGKGVGRPGKRGGIGVPHVIGAFLAAVAFAVGIDVAKSESESILKRNNLWPRG